MPHVRERQPFPDEPTNPDAERDGRGGRDRGRRQARQGQERTTREPDEA